MIIAIKIVENVAVRKEIKHSEDHVCSLIIHVNNIYGATCSIILINYCLI